MTSGTLPFCSIYVKVVRAGHGEGFSAMKFNPFASTLVLLSLVARTSCRFISTTFHFSNQTNSTLPNPCNNADFREPAYHIANIAIAKRLTDENEPDWGPAIRFWATLNFTLRDIANNYTLECKSTPKSASSGWKHWGPDCAPAVGGKPESKQVVTLFHFNPATLLENKSSENPVRLVRYWYCDKPESGQSYPEVYQSKIEFFLNVTCPDERTKDIPIECSVPQNAAISKNEWQPTGAWPGTPKLIPHPIAASPPQGLNPPPAEDCTRMSFARPDWELSNSSYQRGTAKVGFNLASRASGARVSCQGVDAQGESVQVDCVSLTQGLDSRSQFTVGFEKHNETLFIQEDWVCGDVNGTYSTNFTAIAQTTLQGLNNNNTTIKGRLTKPVSLTPGPVPIPLNIDAPGCLSRTKESSTKPLWTLSQFLWQVTNVTASNGFLFPGTPYFTNPRAYILQVTLHNEANNHTQFCNISDYGLLTNPGKWWPCHSQPPPHTFPKYQLETYVQFNANLQIPTLSINQTYFCRSSSSSASSPAGSSSSSNDPEPPVMISALGTVYPGSLICGSSTSTAYNLICTGPFLSQGPCNITYTANWCALTPVSDTNGHGWPQPIYVSSHATPPALNITTLPGGDELTSGPDPDPYKWSCTVNSIGRGPIKWRLRTATESDGRWRKYFAATAWFDGGSDVTTSEYGFDLISSVFEGHPNGNWRTGGLIENVGANSYVTTLTTPWLTGWDPTVEYGSEGQPSWYPGWDVEAMYNILEWKSRLDMTTGYLEVGASWYCDDFDPERP